MGPRQASHASWISGLPEPPKVASIQPVNLACTFCIAIAGGILWLWTQDTESVQICEQLELSWQCCLSMKGQSAHKKMHQSKLHPLAQHHDTNKSAIKYWTLISVAIHFWNSNKHHNRQCDIIHACTIDIKLNENLRTTKYSTWPGRTKQSTHRNQNSKAKCSQESKTVTIK